jgi:thiamine transport system substrate-binding protein
MKRMWIGSMLVLVVLGLAACGPTPTAESPFQSELPTPTQAAEPTSPPARRTLTVMTHDSFAVSEDVVLAFQAECNCQVQFLKGGDTGLLLNQAILSKDNPLADLLFGVDNNLMGRALDAGIFEAYPAAALADIPDDLELDAEHRLLPVDFGDVCLNYDKAYFEEQGLAPPASLEDLATPKYAGLTVVENPATSSPGLAFLLATIAHFGETGAYTYLDYWGDLRNNDVLVTDGWEDAYYGQASWWDGTRPIVVSYATSPAAEVYFSEGALDEPPTGNVLAPDACFRQIEFIGILGGTANRDLAEQWVEFMLGRTFQEDIPLQMWVYPANEKAAQPELFQRFAQVPPDPAHLDPAAIEAHREAWIDAWTNVVLR